jgi:hypothetical protein
VNGNGTFTIITTKAKWTDSAIHESEASNMDDRAAEDWVNLYKLNRGT